jgi:hypothetical protein
MLPASRHLCQLHQVMIDGLHADLSVSVKTLKEKLGPSYQAAFIGVPVHPSASQQQVSDTLRGGQQRGCGRMGSGVRRALSFFDVQVASWWDLDEAAAS